MPSGRVPPPVPPRGSASARGRPEPARGDLICPLHAPGPVSPHALAPARRSTPASQPAPIFRRQIERPPEDDAYIVRTSPYPFRPEPASSIQEPPRRAVGIPRPPELSGYTPSIRMPKFTYFINPVGNAELMNWKMSRKDKKFTETYSERMRRIQEEEDERRCAADGVKLEPPLRAAPPVGCMLQPRKLLKTLRQRRTLVPIPSLGRRLAEMTLWLKPFRRAVDDGLTPGSNTLSSVPGPTVDSRSCHFLGYAYPGWAKTLKRSRSVDGSKLNVRKSGKEKHPETLKKSMSDEEYRVYLDEQAGGQRNFVGRRNSSFLHGYANGN